MCLNACMCCFCSCSCMHVLVIDWSRAMARQSYVLFVHLCACITVLLLFSIDECRFSSNYKKKKKSHVFFPINADQRLNHVTHFYFCIVVLIYKLRNQSLDVCRHRMCYYKIVTDSKGQRHTVWTYCPRK